jgi:hypothetical protein
MKTMNGLMMLGAIAFVCTTPGFSRADAPPSANGAAAIPDAPPSGGVAGVSETMTDRCSEEVAFPPSYDAGPLAHHTIVLKRDPKTGYSPWTTFTRNLGDDGHVRWWCHSTKGNTFDLGTWRIHVDAGGISACLMSVAAAVETDGAAAAGLASCLKVIKIGSSAFMGWTPERSRCGDHSTHFRVRLGPDRLLETQCLGK